MGAHPKEAIVGVCLATLMLVSPSAQAAFPGANGKIAFVSDRDGSLQVYTVDPGGDATTRLTGDPGLNTNPAWSADGRRIAFRCDSSSGEPAICVMNGDGAGRAVVFSDGLYDSMQPAWSPDGRRIAFAWEREFCDIDLECSLHYDVAVINADGTGLRALTDEIGSEFSPAWHPDGSRIAFYGNGLETIRPDGTGRAALIPGLHPNWSPDGSKIAFSQFVPGNAEPELFIANADGSGETRLTNNMVADADPAWSPDGTKIAFTSNDGGDYEIFVMNSDGSGRRALTDHPARDGGPDWQPIPGPNRSDYENAAQFCKAERGFLGKHAFRQKYGGGASAFAKCVSGGHR